MLLLVVPSFRSLPNSKPKEVTKEDFLRMLEDTLQLAAEFFVVVMGILNSKQSCWISPCPFYMYILLNLVILSLAIKSGILRPSSPLIKVCSDHEDSVGKLELKVQKPATANEIQRTIRIRCSKINDFRSSYWVYLRFKEECDVASQCFYALDIPEMRYLPLPNYPVDTYANTASSVMYNKLYVIANPVLGHGMIKFLKPSHAGRIWVRPFHNTCRSELSFNVTEEKFQSCQTVRTSSARDIYTCENKILDLLKSPLPTNLTKLAEDLSVYRRAAVVAAVDVFGGYPVQDEEWCEVYDPSSNTWTPIPGCDTIRTNGMVYYS